MRMRMEKRVQIGLRLRISRLHTQLLITSWELDRAKAENREYFIMLSSLIPSKYERR
jgi:hypothetical protein